ncbi:lipoyl(octanoyl) transferase LipB [Ramlibacter sp. RBP-2]|uniref:Octanoyltransferase n=1 Tax=Ramlibacter lithotrophicus TaxID=2606681 RepID=A0A7X6I865_9BURK|nr:lipoyl(octanoyl) transferase LipB [Ramlibacter lithotrophicus]NKE68261.1 lipoyl(octanoyl) transferase LipB [Ramlibacter lithotrophicus]
MRVELRGRIGYEAAYAAMQAFTAARTPGTPDELWLCEHPPVFTQGIAGRPDHLLAPGDIPVVATNRGGQVTYHGPGQVVAYPMVDLQRAGYFIKEYVYRLEEAVLRTLRRYGVTGHRIAGAPGIYVRVDDPFSHARLPSRGLPSPHPSPAGGRGSNAEPPLPLAGEGGGEGVFTGLGKIAALGVKVSRHCTYHGVALNVAMDLEPFERINPCGYQGLRTVDLSTIGVSTTWNEAAQALGQELSALLAPRRDPE